MRMFLCLFCGENMAEKVIKKKADLVNMFVEQVAHVNKNNVKAVELVEHTMEENDIFVEQVAHVNMQNVKAVELDKPTMEDTRIPCTSSRRKLCSPPWSMRWTRWW